MTSTPDASVRRCLLSWGGGINPRKFRSLQGSLGSESLGSGDGPREVGPVTLHQLLLRGPGLTGLWVWGQHVPCLHLLF